MRYKSKLEHQLKRAVRTIKDNHPLAHSEPLLKNLELLYIHDLYNTLYSLWALFEHCVNKENCSCKHKNIII